MGKFIKWIKERAISTLIIVVLLLIIILQQQCCGNSKPESTGNFWNWHFDVIEKFDTVYSIDTIIVEKKIYIPSNTIYVPIPADVDTANILKEYYAKNIYEDKALDDSTALIIVKDTISQNKIWYRKVTYLDRTPTIINTTVVTPLQDCPKPKQFNLGFGGFISARPKIIKPLETIEQFFGFGPTILLTTNRKSSYGISYDVFNGIGEFSMYYNIK
jgi:hypothetical protein